MHATEASWALIVHYEKLYVRLPFLVDNLQILTRWLENPSHTCIQRIVRMQILL